MVLNEEGLPRLWAKIKALLDGVPKVYIKTKSEYEVLSDEEKNSNNLYIVMDEGGTADATNITYDNSNSGLNATNVNDAIDKLKELINKSSIFSVSNYGASVGNGQIITSVDCAGVVFQIPSNAKYIEFTINNDVYCQYGTCTREASLPTIISTGEGRGNYASTQKAGTYHLAVEGCAGNFFIGGSAGLHVSDIHVYEWF